MTRRIFLVLLLVYGTRAFAQWTPTAGPEGGHGYSLAAIDSTVFLGTIGSGLFKSTDNGGNWVSLNEAIPTAYVSDLEVAGSTLFAATGDGVFRSTDKGTTWASLKTQMGAYGSGTPAYLLGFDSPSLYVSTPIGLLRSQDLGETWTRADTGLPTVMSTVGAWAKSGSSYFAGMSGKGLYRSTDGTSWTRVDSVRFPGEIYGIGTGRRVYAPHFPDPPTSVDYVFVNSSTGVYRSTNEGSSWSGAVSGLRYGAQGHFLTTGSALTGQRILLTGSWASVHYSDDYGQTWTRVGGSSAPTMNCEDMLWFNGRVFAANLPQGVMISNDNGETYTASSTGLHGQEISSLTMLDSTVYAGVFWWGVYASHDEGETWTKLPMPEDLINNFYTVCATSYRIFRIGKPTLVVKNLYAGSTVGMWRSTDLGLTWVQTDSAAYQPRIFGIKNVAEALGQTLYTATSRGVGISHDDGSSWTYSKPSPADSFVTAIDANSNIVIAGTSSGKIYRSTDQGMNWEPWSEGRLSYYARSIAIKDSSVYVGDNAGVWSRTLSGAFWTQNDGIFTAYSFAALPGGVLACSWNGPYYRPDGSSGWSLLGNASGLDCMSAVSLGSRIYLGTTGMSVWKGDFPEVTTAIENHRAESVPAAFALEQNYPNPFNPTTRIGYVVGRVVVPSGALLSGVEPFESPQGSTLSPPEGRVARVEGPALTKVRLAVCDLLGREVAVLVDEKKAPGSYEVSFDASGLASGVYMYRMTAGSFVQSRKMLLLR